MMDPARSPGTPIARQHSVVSLSPRSSDRSRDPDGWQALHDAEVRRLLRAGEGLANGSATDLGAVLIKDVVDGEPRGTRHVSRVVGLLPANVIVVSRQDLRQVLLARSTTALLLLDGLRARLRAAYRRRIESMVWDVRQWLCSVLLDLVDQFPAGRRGRARRHPDGATRRCRTCRWFPRDDGEGASQVAVARRGPQRTSAYSRPPYGQDRYVYSDPRRGVGGASIVTRHIGGYHCIWRYG
jgi:hypothetical protein